MQSYQLDPRRYYPDAQEQSILIPYLRKYFKFPERSPERNRIASEVSNMLLKFSPHWTHRAVRLWFNNNRSTYIKDDKASETSFSGFNNFNSNLNNTSNLNNSTFSSYKCQISGAVSFGCQISPTNVTQTSNININNINSSQQPNSINSITNTFQPNCNFGFNGNLNPSSANINITNNNLSGVTGQLSSISRTTNLNTSGTNLNPTNNNLNNNNLKNNNLNNLNDNNLNGLNNAMNGFNCGLISTLNGFGGSNSNLSTLDRLSELSSNTMSAKPKVGLPSITHLASSSALPSSLPSIEHLVATTSPQLPPRAQSADPNNLKSLVREACGISDAGNERVSAIIGRINQICSNNFLTAEWPVYDQNTVVEFPPRQFALLDLSSLLNSETQIWQDRTFNEQELPKIDFFAVDSGIDSYIIDNCFYVKHGNDFVLISDRLPQGITCYTTSKNYFWATTSNEIFQIPIKFKNDSNCDNIELNEIQHKEISLPFQPHNIFLVPSNDSVIIYNQGLPTVTIISDDMKVTNVKLQLFSPIISEMKSIGENIICSMKNNCVFSLNNLMGNPVRHFFGHTKEPNHLKFLSDNLVMSSAKDYFVKLWDLKVSDPIMTVRSPRKACRCLTGTENALIACYEDATVNVFDIRAASLGKPLLGFDLENANPISVNYDAGENALNLFIEEMRPQAKLRYVYRTYSKLLS
ncbi:hypothetical protein TRFO_40717 [Tritrichomonas foetus]|uniref:Uncharacterized protein n=1 Tax=Tritrichomonas foetus TaxID=1144522 RepID=A0A1J4J006_9EUKA|nr:hypothetical protein TRFO_40717 [Tritrichomonas foetus]|eukprot:OHS92928.1 hypothetical protein TRFO_40717 [Tritrichomonas foetus]